MKYLKMLQNIINQILFNMPTIIKSGEVEFNKLQSNLEPFKWLSSPRLSALGASKDMFFNIRKLDPDKYSYPYHFHRNAEELIIVFEGSATLRTPDGLKIITKGDIIFFEMGSSSAHQIYNHTSTPCMYFDLRTNNGLDVAEFPDSHKIIIGPEMDIFEKGIQVDYFKGEENVAEIWKSLKDK